MKRVRGRTEGRNNLLGGCDRLSEEFCSIRWENRISRDTLIKFLGMDFREKRRLDFEIRWISTW